MKCTLGLCCFLTAAVANQSAALGQAKVEGQQRAMLHADSPQCGAIDLHEKSIASVSTDFSRLIMTVETLLLARLSAECTSTWI